MEAGDINTSQFISISGLVNSILKREGDVGGVKRLKYMEVAKDVYREMNLDGIKQTLRCLLTINKRLHSVNVPDDYYDFSSISGVNADGKMVPLVFNVSLQDDIVDVSLEKDCGCECNCTSSLCHSAKHYETITEEVVMPMPDGSEKAFTKIQRKYIKSNGSFYLEIIEPVVRYDTEGEHVATELVTTENFICKLETKDCGCIVECDENRHLLSKHCCAPDYVYECGCSHPAYFPESATYNISKDGRRLLFPTNFAYDKIILRYYANPATKDILIPLIAKKAMMAGIKYEVANYERTEPMWRINKWGKDYSRAMDVLRARISRCMLNEFYEYVLGRNPKNGTAAY